MAQIIAQVFIALGGLQDVIQHVPGLADWPSRINLKAHLAHLSDRSWQAGPGEVLMHRDSHFLNLIVSHFESLRFESLDI